MAGTDDSRPRLGISSCLLGLKVRYNGADKRDALLIEALGDQVEWVAVCPEVEVGMGTPREPVQLVAGAGGVRMLTVNSRIDYTTAMTSWGERRLDELAGLHISGYVLKQNSPSCGKEGVAVFSADRRPLSSGRGLFADALLRRFPGLPIEQEDALCDVEAIETFLQRVRAYHQHHR